MENVFTLGISLEKNLGRARGLISSDGLFVSFLIRRGIAKSFLKLPPVVQFAPTSMVKILKQRRD